MLSQFALIFFMQEGTLAPHVKSEPIPEVNDQPVKTVVADNLREVVFNSGKNGMFLASCLKNLY